MQNRIIAVLGGTGKEGKGLAYRWARAGYPIIIGSRDAAKAEAAAAELSERVGAGASIRGMENLQAARAADLAVLTVPFAAHRATLEPLAQALEGKILVDVTVPLVPPKITRVQMPPEGSAAQQARAILGDQVEVAAAFQNISHEHLLLDEPVDCDVLVTGTSKETRGQVLELVAAAGLTGWDAGPLENSVVVEGLTCVLIGLTNSTASPAPGSGSPASTAPEPRSPPVPLTLTPLTGIPMIQPGDDLTGILVAALDATGIRLQDGDILVLAQKIVSKAEGRGVDLATVSPSAQARELGGLTEKDPRVAELMLRESRAILRTRPGTAIVEHRLGFVCANAGIDHSNVAGGGDAEHEWVLLLPEDPDRSAGQLRAALEGRTGARLGVMIIDSHGRAWRLGTVGVAIGLSGLPGLIDERGERDLFGYTLQVTVVGVADELAAAASLVMGQAAEGTPVVHVRGFPYPLNEGRMHDLLRPRDQDLFR